MLTTLAERIRERLNELDVSAAELARRSGVKPPSVFLWLDGSTKSIRGGTLLKAAAFLKVTPDWLATGVGKKLSDDASPHTFVAEPTAYYGDRHISESIKILESLNPAARVEALSFLKVFAAKKGAKISNGENNQLPDKNCKAA